MRCVLLCVIGGAFSFARSDVSLKLKVLALELGRRLGDVRSLADGR